MITAQAPRHQPLDSLCLPLSFTLDLAPSQGQVSTLKGRTLDPKVLVTRSFSLKLSHILWVDTNPVSLLTIGHGSWTGYQMAMAPFGRQRWPELLEGHQGLHFLFHLMLLLFMTSSRKIQNKVWQFNQTTCHTFNYARHSDKGHASKWKGDWKSQALGSSPSSTTHQLWDVGESQKHSL